MIVELTILLILIVFSAFFSASEVSFIMLSDAKVDTMVNRKKKRGLLIKKLKSNPRRLLITILIGNNIVNIAAASLATVVATSIFDSAIIGITTGVMTLLILIFGEIIPKSYASNFPQKFATFSAPLLWFLGWALYPFVIAFEWITNLVTGKQQQEQVTEEEIKALTAQGVSQGAVEHHEHRLIRRLFRLNDIKTKNIMTRRDDIVFINSTMPIEQATEIIEHHSYTRYPVFENTPDTIIGYIHSRDVLLVHHRERENIPIKEIVRPVIFIHEDLFIDDLLVKFQQTNTHFAVVIDTNNTILGIVTLEDVLEELVGEITDEYDDAKK